MKIRGHPYFCPFFLGTLRPPQVTPTSITTTTRMPSVIMPDISVIYTGSGMGVEVGARVAAVVGVGVALPVGDGGRVAVGAVIVGASVGEPRVDLVVGVRVGASTAAAL